MFSDLTAEDSEGFEEALTHASNTGKRAGFLAATLRMLLRAYRETFGDSAVIEPIRARLRVELVRLEESE